jgi:hypothetical protein
VSEVSECLRELFSSSGTLTPASLVEVAAAPEHLLHDRFEWDNTLAGHQYRLVQARGLIRSVRVVRDEVSVREYVRLIRRVPAPAGSVELVDLAEESYLPVEVVAGDSLLQSAFLAQMRRDWLLLRRKYEAYGQFWALIQGDDGPSVAA